MCAVKAVGFDLDGTFLSTHVDYESLRNSDRTVLKAHGIPFESVFGSDPPEKRLRAPIREWLEANGRGGDFQTVDREIDDLCTRCELEHLDEAVPFPGSLECIDVLRSRGLKVGILSRGGLEYAEKALGKFGVLDKMDAVMGRDHSSYDEAKPSPVAMHQFANLLDVRPEEIVYLGDNLSDYQSARDAGALFVGVLSGAADEAFWRAQSPDIPVVRYAADITGIIGDYI